MAKQAERPTNKQLLQERLQELFSSESYVRHETIGNYLINGIGGSAEHLVVATDTGAIVAAAQAAIASKEPYIIIAHGTGSLVSHIGFPGLVIINKTNNVACSPSTSEALVDSGVSNAELVNILASKSFGALEFLSMIPGTIGGAVATGAGFADKHILTYVKELIMFVPDSNGGKVINVPANQLPRRGGSLMFPASENSPIILSVRLQLARIDQAEIFRRLQQLRQRSRIQQQSLTSVGYFVFPPITEEQSQTKEFKSIVLPKGIRLSRKDANLLEFRADTTSEQIREAVQIITGVLRGHGVTLEERLSYLGYWPSKEEYSATTDTESFSV